MDWWKKKISYGSRVIIPEGCSCPKSTSDFVEHRNDEFPENHIKTTKYTPLTFIPLNILEQYKRASNWYFTLIKAVNFIPAVEATNPWVSVTPLLVVLATTAIKDIIEDLYRWRCDKQINHRRCLVYDHVNKRFVEQVWSNVKVGDIVQLQVNDTVPADIILIASSEEEGICFLETSDLDGETNLKQKQSITMQRIRGPKSMLDIAKDFHYYIKCHEPSTKLHEFEGSIHKCQFCNGNLKIMDAQDSEAGLVYDNFMMRGCVIRNTDYALGVVVYTGGETKTMLNNCGPRRKRSKLEDNINCAVLGSFVLQMLMCTIVAILNNAQTGSWLSEDTRELFYPKEVAFKPWLNGGITFLRVMVIFQVIIPIALYVSIEFVKLFQVYFIQRDRRLYDEETKKQAQCRAMNITEDLGQIQYIFSDKTGTLTENKMEFRKCSIDGRDYAHGMQKRLKRQQSSNGKQYHHRPAISAHINDLAMQTMGQFLEDEPKLEKPELNLDQQLYDDILEGSPNVAEFFRCLAICNTVMPSTDTTKGRIEDSFYEGESPDEVALIYACQRYQFYLVERKKKSVELKCGPNQMSELYEILHVLPFTSARKRMSVIVKKKCVLTDAGLENGEAGDKIIMYTKGADDILLSMCEGTTDGYIIEDTREHLATYAREGLRTLCMSWREIDNDEYDRWLVQLKEAEATLVQREEKIQQCYRDIEDALVLLGASGIEDRLQQDVAQSIEAFRTAGIKVWVITGDKIETAVNIAYSSKLFTDNNGFHKTELYFTKHTKKKTAVKALHDLEMNVTQSTNLVLDGQSLDFILDDVFLSRRFIKVIQHCGAVLCCRVTPMQKGQIVQLVKDQLGVMTLAIGDGANDVSMLQIANVGIGISGLEGMQAVLNSDFSVPKFKYLRTLLFVHGHWCYYRLANMILYFFYRSVVFVCVLFMYQFVSGFYGSSVVEDSVLYCFSILFLSAPPIAHGALTQDLNRQTLMSNSKLYRQGMNSEVYRIPRSYFIFIGLGLWQSLCCFLVAYYATLDTGPSGTVTTNFLLFGYYTTSGTLFLNLTSQAIEYKSLTWIHWTALFGSWLLFITFIGVTTQASLFVPTGFGMFWMIFGSVHYWLCLIMIVAMGCFPHVICRVLQTELWPTECQYEATLEIEREGVSDSTVVHILNEYWNRAFSK